jgi:hypothetical protein
MKVSALILLASIAQVSAGTTAYYKVAWVKADGAWSVEIGATIAATTAGTAKEIVLPTNFLCKPGEIPKAMVTDSAGAAEKVHCSNADGKALTSLTCSADGKKLTLKVGVDCAASQALKLKVLKSHIFPIAEVTAKDAVFQVGAETPSGDSDFQFMNVAAALGAAKGTSPTFTLSDDKIGGVGTLTYETTFPAAPTMIKTDKICLFYPGFKLQKDAECSITSDTKAAAAAIKVAAEAADRHCLEIAADDQIPTVSKKFKVVCTKFANPTASQIALGFGAAFTDESDSQSDVFDAKAGVAITKTKAPTRAPTVPTRAPTRAFSAAPRSAAATGVAGFVSAVVAYFLF